jgi:hypothetical protein
MGTFVDLVKKGTPMDLAAQQAKSMVLDFRDLTQTEQKYMRLFVTFYAFMRKNSDAYVRALLTHPERVTAQMRLAHASLTNSGLTGIELGNMKDQDVGRLAFANDEEVVDQNGRPNPLFRFNRIVTSPISVAEWLMQMRMLTSPLTGSQQGQTDLLSSGSPFIQALAVGIMGRKLERDFDSPDANRIPPFLMDAFPGLMVDVFGAGPQVMDPEKDDLSLADDDASRLAGAPARWVAGSAYTNPNADWQRSKQKYWQSAMVWLARPAGQAEQIAEAAGFEHPPSHMTQLESTVDAMLGVKHRPVVAENEAIRKFKARKVGELNQATQAIRLPEGVGPRP